MISLRRVYDPPVRGEGQRFLVDRLWPRGVAKSQVGRHRWMPEVAPSPELRAWFGHDPARWKTFRGRYLKELKAHPEVVAPLIKAARKHSIVLLYAAADGAHSNAVVLRDYVRRRAHSPSHSGKSTCGARSRSRHAPG